MPVLDSHVFDITRAIQLAVAPVFLLTAIGTLGQVFSFAGTPAADRSRPTLPRALTLDELHRVIRDCLIIQDQTERLSRLSPEYREGYRDGIGEVLERLGVPMDDQPGCPEVDR